MAPKENSNGKKFDIDDESIRQLAALMEETGLTEIEVTEGDRHVRVAKTQAMVNAPAYTPQAASSGAQTQTGSSSAPAAPHPGSVTSPMVGTAYLRPDPSSPPFVQAGDAVSAGDTLLIIEAMKVMNPIKAPQSGKVSLIVVSDSQPVEFGEVLMIVE